MLELQSFIQPKNIPITFVLDIYGPFIGPSQRWDLTLHSHTGFMPSAFHSTYTCESQVSGTEHADLGRWFRHLNGRDCSCRGLKFSSEHHVECLITLVTSVPLASRGMCTHMHMDKHRHIHNHNQELKILHIIILYMWQRDYTCKISAIWCSNKTWTMTTPVELPK